MRLNRVLLFVSASMLLGGCQKPVPPEKAAYVGEWQEKSVYLLIKQDGSVSYKREKENGSTSINAPIKGFSGDNFDVGVGPMATTFVVSKPPYQSGHAWKMVVDNVELTKTSD